MAGRDHNPQGRRLHLSLVEAPAVDFGRERKPEWLRAKLTPEGPNARQLKAIVRKGALHTVCEEASCPNISECWEDREATFLVLGDRCTRRCGFCDVMTAKPLPPDPAEPESIAEAVELMGLRFAVITGVARDDLPLGGADIWAACVVAIRRRIPDCGVELLPPDFSADEEALRVILDVEPSVFAHNLETVRRLHTRIRPAFDYDRSLEVLRMAKRSHPGQVTKSNIIAGMGETPDEILESLADLAAAGCEIVTMGQYLQPTKHHLPVERWVTPEEFAEYKTAGESMGIAHVEAGPLVRSSYRAGHQYHSAIRAVGAGRLRGGVGDGMASGATAPPLPPPNSRDGGAGL